MPDVHAVTIDAEKLTSSALDITRGHYLLIESWRISQDTGTDAMLLVSRWCLTRNQCQLIFLRATCSWLKLGARVTKRPSQVVRNSSFDMTTRSPPSKFPVPFSVPLPTVPPPPYNHHHPFARAHRALFHLFTIMIPQGLRADPVTCRLPLWKEYPHDFQKALLKFKPLLCLSVPPGASLSSRIARHGLC